MPKGIWLCLLSLLAIFVVHGKHISGVSSSQGHSALAVICQARQLQVQASKAAQIQANPRSPLRQFIDAFKLSYRQGLSGGFAGLVQVITMMWLRTTVTYQHRYGVSTMQALRELWDQGGIPRFYRGVAYAVVQAPLCRFGSVAANEISNILVGVPTGSDEGRAGRKTPSSKVPSSLSSSSASHEYVKIVLAATLGSLLSTIWRIILMPLDTCKTVLQVDGASGFNSLMTRVLGGDITPLFRGTTATIVATWVGHSWFLFHNWLDAAIAVPPSANGRVMRAAVIGFLASAVSDGVSNFIKVIKTVKQAMLVDAQGRAASPSYEAVVRYVLAEGGYAGLFGRGLLTRVASNGIQSVVFTVLWKVCLSPATKQQNRRKEQH